MSGAQDIHRILRAVAEGRLTIEAAEAAIVAGRAEELSFATLDHDRSARCGVPEVVYAAGKSVDQVVQIARRLVEVNGYALVTRASMEQGGAIEKAFDEYETASRGGAYLVGRPPEESGTPIAIVTAGTSDEAVAEEAVLTCRALGQRTVRYNDVGVAGLHRLLNRIEEVRRSHVVICIAGMEGALPSVIGGLVRVPVIAVPTSVGYGAAFGGVAALLGMLTSCAAGVTVVNIDNGFGAAYSAAIINRLADGTAGGRSTASDAQRTTKDVSA